MMRREDNPDVTYPAATPVSAMQGRWWVAHTKSRQEKALAQDLGRLGISYFLPLVERVRFRSGRRYEPLMALFPGYVFVCGDDEDRERTFRGNRVASTLRVEDQTQLIRELAEIQKAVEAEAPMDIYPGMVRGRRCRVVGGPFAGIEGKVMVRKDVERLVLSVGALGQAVALEIDASCLEVID